MKRFITSILLALVMCSVQAQDIDFSIKPYPVADTAERMQIRIVLFRGDSMLIYYRLYNTIRTVEDGNRWVPKQLLYVLAASPIDYNSLNMALRAWRIEAIKEEEEPPSETTSEN